MSWRSIGEKDNILVELKSEWTGLSLEVAVGATTNFVVSEISDTCSFYAALHHLAPFLCFRAADPVEADNALGSFARLQKALERGQASSVVGACFALMII